MGAGLASLVCTKPWRLLAPIALHVDGVHLVLNRLALASIGPLLGWLRFFVVFVCSVLGGNLASSLRTEDAVSASGGVWGLVVGTGVLFSFRSHGLPPAFAAATRPRVWTPVAINALYSLSPGVDLLAHPGGGLTGGALVFLVSRGRSGQRPPTPASLCLPALSDLLSVLGSEVVASLLGRPWELRGRPAMTTRSAGPAVTLVLPSSLRPAQVNDAFVLGRRLTDPVALVVGLEADLSDEQRAAREQTMEASRETLQTAIDGFTPTTPPEVLVLDERRVLLRREVQASDGRRAINRWLFVDRSVLDVIVFVAASAPPAWAQFAREIAPSAARP
ncbi:MAG: rhomboid family intramembrane serine protease [Myxococcaceae bacterium]|jgi:hypothetical protein|nr:rhomboid family intramembrane serine protease [Myxococcaceae bacterium]MCA3012373.1 rhomboid family intramembrane serine protease [Myxococcaceae bacterium]